MSRLLLPPLPSRSRRRTLLLTILSNTLSASTLAPPPPLPPLSPLLLRRADDEAALTPVVCSITGSFRDWFLLSRRGSAAALAPPAALDAIYGALAAKDKAAVEALPLSEELVLAVLRHRPRHLPDDDALLVLRLKFFDWSGSRRRYSHTRAVYHAVFRLLSRARRSALVVDWLRLFSNTTASPARSRFHDTLVVGYAVAGDPQRGLSILGRMRFRGLYLDAFSSHILLNSLVEASLHDYAVSFARHLVDSPVATCIRIKSLCRQARIRDAVDLLDTLPFDQASSGPAAGSIITEMCRRGRFDNAAQLVDKFSSADVYGAWIHGLIEAGRLDTTLQFLSDKKEAEGYIPDAHRYDKLMYRLLRNSRLGEVYDLLVEMMEEGIAPGRSTMNAALCFFCKAGLVEVAAHLYLLENACRLR